MKTMSNKKNVFIDGVKSPLDVTENLSAVQNFSNYYPINQHVRKDDLVRSLMIKLLELRPEPTCPDSQRKIYLKGIVDDSIFMANRFFEKMNSEDE